MADKSISRRKSRFNYKVDFSGQKFERLLVIAPIGEKLAGTTKYECRCDCGEGTIVEISNLVSGNTKSCGCLYRETRKGAQKHGMRNSPEYKVWKGMRVRCNNPNSNCYQMYGGRGIKVSPIWDDFLKFYEDVGPRPSPQYSIDRKDTNGNYEPGNCRWALPKEQARNSRWNRKITFNGETLCLIEWEEKLGLPKGILANRLFNGFTEEESLTLPRHSKARKKKAA